MKVLAISAWKRSGKDTLYDRLASLGAVRVSFADPLKDRVAEEYGIRRADLDEQDKKEQPILSLPVDPQDAFTRTIANLLVREFRTADGRVATIFVPESGNLGVVTSDQGVNYYDKLYWTPRALAIFKGSGNRAVASNYWVQQAIQKIQQCEESCKTAIRTGMVNPEYSGLVVVPDLRFKSEVSQLRDAFGDQLITIRINRFNESPSTDASERDLDDGKFDIVIENKGTLEEFYAKVDDLVYSLDL